MLALNIKLLKKNSTQDSIAFKVQAVATWMRCKPTIQEHMAEQNTSEEEPGCVHFES